MKDKEIPLHLWTPEMNRASNRLAKLTWLAVCSGLPLESEEPFGFCTLLNKAVEAFDMEEFARMNAILDGIENSFNLRV